MLSVLDRAQRRVISISVSWTQTHRVSLSRPLSFSHMHTYKVIWTGIMANGYSKKRFVLRLNTFPLYVPLTLPLCDSSNMHKVSGGWVDWLVPCRALEAMERLSLFSSHNLTRNMFLCILTAAMWSVLKCCQKFLFWFVSIFIIITWNI